MPKRRVSAKQAAASRRNLIKARAARKKIPRSRYKSKAELPHVYSERYTKSNGIKMLYARAYAPGKRRGTLDQDPFGYLGGYVDDNNKVILTEVIKASVRRNHPKTATLSPGIDLLTAGARMTPSGKGFKVRAAVKNAWPFYELTGGKQIRGTRHSIKGRVKWADYSYSPAAQRALAGRRIVRVHLGKKR